MHFAYFTNRRTATVRNFLHGSGITYLACVFIVPCSPCLCPIFSLPFLSHFLLYYSLGLLLLSFFNVLLYSLSFLFFHFTISSLSFSLPFLPTLLVSLSLCPIFSLSTVLPCPLFFFLVNFLFYFLPLSFSFFYFTISSLSFSLSFFPTLLVSLSLFFLPLSLSLYKSTCMLPFPWTFPRSSENAWRAKSEVGGARQTPIRSMHAVATCRS